MDNLGRQSGFLIPAIGQSNTKGTIIGDSFYWAINRNSDAEIGGFYFSSRGWAQTANYRNIGWHYSLHAEYFGVIDEQGDPKYHQNQGGEEIKVNGAAALPYGFRGVVSVDYLSSYVFRLAFGQSFTEAINSEVRSAGFVSKSWSGNFLGLYMSRYQNYQSTVHGDVIDIAHIPSFQMAGLENPIAGSKFMYTYDLAGEGVSRHEPGFQTQNVVGTLRHLPDRLAADVLPRMDLPTGSRLARNRLQRTTASHAEQYRSDRHRCRRSLEPQRGVGVDGASASVCRPHLRSQALRLRDEARCRALRGLSLRNRRQQFRQHHPFRLPRHSGRFQFGGIRRGQPPLRQEVQIEFRVLPESRSTFRRTRLPQKRQRNWRLTRRICDDKAGAAREIFTFTIAQKYFFNPTFGGALVPNQRNVFDSSVDFSGIAFLTQPRNASPIITRALYSHVGTSIQWDMDYDPVFNQVNASTVFLGQRLTSKWSLLGGETYLHVPGEVIPSNAGQILAPDISNQFRVQLTYGSLASRGFSGAASIGYDVRNHYLQGTTIQTNYNWDCCGLTFEYSRWALGTVRNENAYRFAFSLSNVGTFGNLKRLQRIY